MVPPSAAADTPSAAAATAAEATGVRGTASALRSSAVVPGPSHPVISSTGRDPVQAAGAATKTLAKEANLFTHSMLAVVPLVCGVAAGVYIQDTLGNRMSTMRI